MTSSRRFHERLKPKKIHYARPHSFSVIGICIIPCPGGMLIMIGCCIEWITSLMERHWLVLKSYTRKHDSLAGPTACKYSKTEWMTTPTLQPQRFVHEAFRTHTWRRTHKPVPITETGNALGVLDIHDRRHPVWRAACAEDVKLSEVYKPHVEHNAQAYYRTTHGVSLENPTSRLIKYRLFQLMKHNLTRAM